MHQEISTKNLFIISESVSYVCKQLSEEQIRWSSKIKIIKGEQVIFLSLVDIPDTTYIAPNSDHQCKSEEIFLLTNGASGSSADVFALVMSYLPNISIIGTNTEGIFSDMYRDTLSNGWRITLSDEKYFSKGTKCYEKIGIPVDLEVENKFKDVEKGIDLVIETMINERPAAHTQ